MLTIDRCPKRSDDVIWRSIDGEVVIMPSFAHEIHKLNRVGSAIWELSDGTKNMSEIATLISTRFDASTEILQKDVIEFGSQLFDKKLLVFASDDSNDK